MKKLTKEKLFELLFKLDELMGKMGETKAKRKKFQKEYVSLINLIHENKGRKIKNKK